MPPELLQQLPILLAIMFVAAVIQGATGFGFGLFSVAAMSLFLQLKVSTPLLAIVNAPVILYLLWQLRRWVVWKGLGPIIAGLLVGIPFGIFVLVSWPQDVLLRVLGVVLLAAAARSLMASNGTAREGGARSSLVETGVGLGVGAATGALAGAFNTGGPPIIAYVYCRPWSKEQRTATLEVVFAISVFTRIAVMIPAGLYDVPLLLTAAACVPVAMLGMPVGYAIFRRFPQRGLEVFVAVFLAFVGMKLLIWP